MRRRALETVPASLALRLSCILILINRARTLYQSGNEARKSEAKTRRRIKLLGGIFINRMITDVTNRMSGSAECLGFYKSEAIANSKNV